MTMIFFRTSFKLNSAYHESKNKCRAYAHYGQGSGGQYSFVTHGICLSIDCLVQIDFVKFH